LYVHELAAMRDVMRVTTIQRVFAADSLQMQPAEATLTSSGCNMKEQWRGSIEPLAAAMATE
jgi:hypothetical protein